jgi:hypothetical protein
VYLTGTEVEPSRNRHEVTTPLLLTGRIKPARKVVSLTSIVPFLYPLCPYADKKGNAERIRRGSSFLRKITCKKSVLIRQTQGSDKTIQ